MIVFAGIPGIRAERKILLIWKERERSLLLCLQYYTTFLCERNMFRLTTHFRDILYKRMKCVCMRGIRSLVTGNQDCIYPRRDPHVYIYRCVRDDSQVAGGTVTHAHIHALIVRARGEAANYGTEKRGWREGSAIEVDKPRTHLSALSPLSVHAARYCCSLNREIRSILLCNTSESSLFVTFICKSSTHCAITLMFHSWIK